MAWTTPPVHVQGDVIPAADWNILANDTAFLFGDTGWINLSFTGTWSVNSGYTPQYRKIGTVVYMVGSVIAGSGQPSGTNIASLPAGYTPPHHQWLYDVHANWPSFIEVTAGGAVNVGVSGGEANPTQIWFDNVQFDTLA